jgi:hypothetical protein
MSKVGFVELGGHDFTGLESTVAPARETRAADGCLWRDGPNQMKFDTVLTNPPFQDSVNRKKTPHKLWIDFTLAVFDRMLEEGGSLVQVSPASFSSPSNIVLDLMEANQTMVLRLGTEHHFPDIGSTRVMKGSDDFVIELDKSIWYLPNDVGRLSLSVHSKVMFAERPRLPIEWDYVTAHNIRRYDEEPTLREERSATHVYPVFHTNRKTWWSSLRQEWADCEKVMWTRSGYTKPFFDRGELGGTDMVYFVRVGSTRKGEALAHNLNTTLIQYIFKTAKWSGFGNERVFAGLPDMRALDPLSDDEMFGYFQLDDEEVAYVRESLAPSRRKA